MSKPTDKTSKSWEVLMSELSSEILAGKYASDKPMPGEYPLCERFGCSRTTVRRAMVELEKKGLIYRRHGKGTYAHPVSKMDLPAVGLLIRKPERLAGDYFVELIRGCNSYLNSLGSQTTIITQPPHEWSPRLYESLCGVIVIPTGVNKADTELLRSNNCPYVVMLESQLPGPHVNMNVQQSAYDLTTLLLKKGHRKIAFISGHKEHSDRSKRLGIARALSEYDISLEELTDIEVHYDLEKAHKAAEEILSQKSRPTAILAFDDMIAIEAIKVAREIGLKLPRQLSVVGFNNSPMGSLVTPSLTTVHFPIHEAGRAASRMIAGQYLKGTKIKTISLNSGLVVRESVAALPGRKK